MLGVVRKGAATFSLEFGCQEAVKKWAKCTGTLPGHTENPIKHGTLRNVACLIHWGTFRLSPPPPPSEAVPLIVRKGLGTRPDITKLGNKSASVIVSEINAHERSFPLWSPFDTGVDIHRSGTFPFFTPSRR
jgi:hypothetical protein